MASHRENFISSFSIIILLLLIALVRYFSKEYRVYSSGEFTKYTSRFLLLNVEMRINIGPYTGTAMCFLVVSPNPIPEWHLRKWIYSLYSDAKKLLSVTVCHVRGNIAGTFLQTSRKFRQEVEKK